MPKEYLTTFKGPNPLQDPDPITNVMPDLGDETTRGAFDGDEARTSQIEAPRDKLDTVCKLVGDSTNAPATSIRNILDVDHGNGDATQVRFRVRATAPAAVSQKAFLYALDDGGITKLYIKWDDGTETLIGAGVVGGQTNTVTGSNGITNTGTNVDAVLEPSYGSSANTVCEGDDSRLSDSRTPLSHASDHEPGGADAMAVDAAVATGSLRTLGTGAQQACAGNDSRLSDARTPTSHASSHQNGGGDEISVAGLSGLLADDQNPVNHASDHEPGGGDAMAVDAAVATGSLRTLGTGAQQACAGDDSRLSDTRTPTSHASSHEPGGGDALAVDAIPATGSLRTLGTGSQQACAGDDARLSDARTPTSHAASHQHGGADEVATATPAANAVPKAGAGGTLAGGWVSYGSSASTACEGDDARLSDARTPTSHAVSHQFGGGDAIKLDDLAAPDDNTDLNVSTLAHGLCPKLSGIATDGLKGDGTFGPVSPLTTKGDIYGYSTGPVRVAVGPDGYVLNAESGVAAGVVWRKPQTSYEQVIDSSVTGAFDTELRALVYGGGALDTPSGYDLLVFRDGVKMTYAATPSASNEYWYNPATNEVRVIGDGSAHRWEVCYRSTTSGGGGTFGTATFGTATFDG